MTISTGRVCMSCSVAGAEWNRPLKYLDHGEHSIDHLVAYQFCYFWEP